MGALPRIEEKVVKIYYENYQGRLAWRLIVPKKLEFGATKFHPTAQWLLYAYDLGKRADRTFALQDIQTWMPCPEDEAQAALEATA